MIELRAVTEYRSTGRRLEGYAARFAVEARIGDFIEVIKAGAFNESLSSKKDILALVDHDQTRVLARTRSGNLKLSEDSQGLSFDISLPATRQEMTCYHSLSVATWAECLWIHCHRRRPTVDG